MTTGKLGEFGLGDEPIMVQVIGLELGLSEPAKVIDRQEALVAMIQGIELCMHVS